MFKKFGKISMSLIFAFVFLISIADISNAQSDIYLTKKAKNGVFLKYIVIDMNSPEYNLELSYNENFKVGNFSNFITKKNTKDKKVIAAINGTYFQSYKNDGTLGMPWYGLYADGVQLKEPWNGARFVYTNNRRYAVERVAEFTNGKRTDCSYKMAEKLAKVMAKPVFEIDAGPSVLMEGKSTINPSLEGFTETKVVSSTSQRSFIASTKNNKIIIGTAVANPAALAEALKEIGAYNAICLDGGASSALWYRGKTYTSPGRQLSNVLVITESNGPVDMSSMPTKDSYSNYYCSTMPDFEYEDSYFKSLYKPMEDTTF